MMLGHRASTDTGAASPVAISPWGRKSTRRPMEERNVSDTPLVENIRTVLQDLEQRLDAAAPGSDEDASLTRRIALVGEFLKSVEPSTAPDRASSSQG